MGLALHDTAAISIHAPRVGGDGRKAGVPVDAALISIHAPRVGGDPGIAGNASSALPFQSTPPVWGATPST